MNPALRKLLSGEKKQTQAYARSAQSVHLLQEAFRQKTDGEVTKHAEQQREQSEASPEEMAATAAEAARRSLRIELHGNQIHDNQIQGMLALADRTVVELATGEGKTVMAAAYAHLACRNGRQLHIMTANSYLAERDQRWMKPLHDLLALETAAITEASSREEVAAAAQADIIYSTAAVLATWQLRNEQVTALEQRVNLRYETALIDEADTVLLDLAGKNFALAEDSQHDPDRTRRWEEVARSMTQNDEKGEGGHFGVDQVARVVALSEKGWDRLQAEHGIDLNSSLSEETLADMAALNTALFARALMHKGRDYLVHEGKILPIERHTGRAGKGRFPDGLHAALEAKEKLDITPDITVTVRTTLSRQLKRYSHICGMTATAKSAEDELQQLYNLSVVQLPENITTVRRDLPDLVYPTREKKLEALTEDVAARSAKKQPVLICVETLDDLYETSRLLAEKGVEHATLSADSHEEEAELMAQAGKPGQVTLATRMAGRGVDIVLGGPQKMLPQGSTEAGRSAADDPCEDLYEEAVQAGGLCVVGAQRFDTRRADDQLRGRAGRQGDPGESRFYLSMEDDILRSLGGAISGRAITRLTDAAGESSGHAALTKLVDKAQKQQTAQQEAIRKNMMVYAELIEEQRDRLLLAREQLLHSGEEADPVEGDATEDSAPEERTSEEIRVDTLRKIDALWAVHLAEADEMRRAAGLRQIGRLDPRSEFMKEMSARFSELLDTVRNEIDKAQSGTS